MLRNESLLEPPPLSDVGPDNPHFRRLSQNSIDRTLVARLEYTRAQRGTTSLMLRDDGRLALSWFSYMICGVPTGLHEGILLGQTDELSPAWLHRVADDTGAALFKLTRPAPPSPGPIPVATGTVQAHRTRDWVTIRRATRARELLPLAPTYDETLAGFGRHTRRNIRSARKAATAERFTFAAATSEILMADPARADLARSTRPSVTVSLTRRLEAYAVGTGRPFRTVIRALDGRIVSYTCGYFGDPAVAYLLYQLNDPAWSALGPSLLHRAYLLQWLIERGCTALVFVHGCSGILHHACIRHPLEEIFLMRRAPKAYLTATSIAVAKPNTSLGRLTRLALSPRVLPTALLT